MSPPTSTCFLLLLLLSLCFSLHACNARRIRSTLVHHKNLENKTHFSSIKNDNNNNNNNNKGIADLSPKQVGSRKQIITSGLVGEAEKPRIGVIRRRVLKSSKGRKATSSSSSKQENHIIHHDQSDDDVGVSWVSWRVPHHKKRGNKNPGFNLDYSPPKTHPPSHN